jgi:hypothetical protein
MAVNLWEDKHRDEMLNIYALAYQSCFMDQCADPAVFETAAGAVNKVQTDCAEESASAIDMIQCSAACKKSLFEYRSSSCVILAIQKLSPNAQQLFWTQLSGIYTHCYEAECEQNDDEMEMSSNAVETIRTECTKTDLSVCPAACAKAEYVFDNSHCGAWIVEKLTLEEQEQFWDNYNRMKEVCSATTHDELEVTIRSAGSSLMINAFGGASSGVPLRLNQNCKADNKDCLWKLQAVASGQYMIRCAAGLLPVNAFDGAKEGTRLHLNDRCEISNPDCLWIIQRVEKERFMIQSATNMYPVRAEGGSHHEAYAQLTESCQLDDPACLWVIDPDPDPKGCQNAESVQNATAAVTGVLHHCSAISAEGTEDPECTQECRNQLRQFSYSPCAAWALGHAPNIPQAEKDAFFQMRQKAYRTCFWST